MCAPILPIIGAVTSVVGTVASFQAQSAQMQAQADANRASAEQAKMQAHIAHNDAVASKINARTELQKSHFEAQKQRARTSAIQAQQAAQAGASGFDAGSGSAALLVNETGQTGKMDELTTLWSGEASHTSLINQANDLTVQSNNFMNSANRYSQAAGNLGGSRRGTFASIMAGS